MDLCGHFLAQALVHGLLDRADDVLVAGAAAEVAGEELAQLGIGLLLAALHDLPGAHNEAGGAEAALDGSLIDKGLLNIGQFAVGAHKAL